MAWNEPGKGRDPWGDGKKKDGNNGPPDLDEIWRRLRARFSGGGRGGRPGAGGGSGGPSGQLILGIVVVGVAIWLATGLYVVQPGEKGVLLRFGAYIKTVNPGWHWRAPSPITSLEKVDTQKVRRASNRAVMLTRNENFVDVQVTVQYRVAEPMKYLFMLKDPDSTVEQVLRSAVREVVGTSRMNQVIQEGVNVDQLKDDAVSKVDLKKNGKQSAEKKNPLKDIEHKTVRKIKKQQQNYPKIERRSRAKLPANVRKIMQTTLDRYEAGIQIVAVNVQYAQPPEQVQGAFEEAIKAREQKEQKKNLARAYARKILAQAQGQKAQKLAEARGYKEQKISRAEGQAKRFGALLGQYQEAPQVTRERLYLQTMGEVLSSSHLLLDDGGSNSMMYMPLQKLMGGGHRNKSAEKAANQGPNSGGDNSIGVPFAPEQGSSQPSADNPRSRSRNS